MSGENHTINRKIKRQALFTYGLLSLIVYCAAIAYCLLTDFFWVGIMLAAIMMGLGIFAIRIYTSIDKEE